ncbi:hypothetical protein BCD67_03985 [Oscillatoriales cyanobacterium USR001]|nr:hypothetical protein BCD67_03985 [Oscillatoriales cyanobacterium USR001]
MSGTSERIEREIAGVEEAIASLTIEFYNIYNGYLTVLGQATKKQLILACYHICTQVYPDSFIKLSFNQRQKMQQSLRKLAIANSEKLQLLLKPEEEELEESEEVEELAENEGWQEASEKHEADRREIKRELANYTTEKAKLSNPKSPEYLINWQERMEKGIVKNLKSLSRDSNRCLQNAGILPKQLPAPILEAASNTETSGDAIAGPPNLLNLIIETVESEDSEADLENLAANLARLGGSPSPNAMHITAINLRLSEIEFADANVTGWRQQIRNLSMRLNTLRRDYHKKQRERTIVEAESAWRACWFED